MKPSPGEEMIAMNARQCEALTQKATRVEADGSEAGRLKGAYLRAAAKALSSGRARKVLRAAGSRPDPDCDRRYREAREDMRVARQALAERGIRVKDITE